MDAQLQTQYYMLLGMLEDAGPTARRSEGIMSVTRQLLKPY